jgi:hypothetical protein
MITLPRTAVRQWLPNFDTLVPIAVYEQIHLVLNFDTTASLRRHYTERFIMFSVITDINNKKTKGPTLIELSTATGKQTSFFDQQRCSMCEPRVTRHISIRYSSSCHTRVYMDASVFFTAAMIRNFRQIYNKKTKIPT